MGIDRSNLVSGPARVRNTEPPGDAFIPQPSRRIVLPSLLLLCFLVGARSLAAAATVVLTPVADTFLSEFSPTNNAGANPDMAVGTVNNGTRTRGLIRFDITTNLPVGVTVTAASLKLTVSRINSGGGANSTFDLRRVLHAWNEGTKSGNRGAGAGPGEATWQHRLFPGVAWSAPGGAMGTDFSATLSASTPVAGLGSYEFASSPALVRDLQFWLENPAANFGWVLLTELEDTPETSRRFASREDAEHSPTLTIEYAPPPPPFRITSVTITGGQAVVAWTNGVPMYQVQMRSSLAQPWANVGPPANRTRASVPLNGSQAFFRVVSGP